MTEPQQRPEHIPPLVTMGHPSLARPSAEVEPSAIRGEAFQRRLDVLAEAMVYYLGIGIAAPQVGWFERFFVSTETVAEPGREARLLAVWWINPRIVEASAEHNWAWEGCLSVPGLRGWIRRPAAVVAEGYNREGEPVRREFSGWDARVFQHEYDHVEGMLFPYRARDPRHLVSLDAMEYREQWPADWPAPGARDAEYGQVLPDPEAG